MNTMITMPPLRSWHHPLRPTEGRSRLHPKGAYPMLPFYERPPLGLIRTQKEYDSAKSRYEEAIQKSCQWEDDLEKKYNEDQQMDIMSIISYWENQLRGFGKQNDERLYESIRKEDSSGQLFEEAKKGFEYAKLCLELGPPVRKWGIKNKKKSVRDQ